MTNQDMPVGETIPADGELARELVERARSEGTGLVGSAAPSTPPEATQALMR